MASSMLPLVRAGILVPFAALLDELGLASWKYLEAERLLPEPQGNVEELVPFLSVLNLTERVSRATGIEDLGYVVGARSSLAVLGNFGNMLVKSVSLSQALHKVVAAVSLFNSGEFIWLRREGDSVLMCHDFSVPDRKGRWHGDCFAMLRFIDLVGLAAPPGWVPDAVYVRPADFVHRKRYADLFKTRIELGGNYCGIKFDASLLAAPLKPQRGEAVDVGMGGELASTAPLLDLTGSVRQAVTSLLHSGFPDLGFVAELTGMSTRNLQRHLKSEGLSYSQIVDESRFEIARRLLEETDLKLIDVAFEAGYGEPANFTRAFKRWAGMAPKTFKRLLAPSKTTN